MLISVDVENCAFREEDEMSTAEHADEGLDDDIHARKRCRHVYS